MNTPELDKMHACREKSQAQGEFLDWLISEKGIVLAKYSDDSLYEHHVRIEDLLAEFHGIDLRKVEEERRALLDEVVRQRGGVA